MKCPKCESNMEHIHNPLADYEQCTHCKGLWLDMLEDQDLKSVADAIDDGDPELGKTFDQKTNVSCPVCSNSTMISMVVPGQWHINFEQCSSCKGRFYDAGEFKDASEKTLGEYLKYLFG